MSRNPFNNLYLAEEISADRYVSIFSPVLLRESETHLLFQPGSIILRGLQGSGKSALLNLLKPDVVLAYLKSDQGIPLPSHCAKFLSASVSIRNSGALDFGQRQFEQDRDKNNSIVGLYFADFLNYWIVDDLLKNLDFLASAPARPLMDFLCIDTSIEKLDEFAENVSKQDCWFGALRKVSDFRELRETIRKRVYEYDSFLNFNSELPNEFSNTKSKPGIPIGVVAEELKRAGILPHDVPIFISIDQFEDLMDLEKDIEGNFSTIFRSVIMRMLGSRDERVSYRVGARPYSLTTGLQGFGNNAFAEELREFHIVDMGALLRASETKGSLFPKFCDDVFRRRIRDAELETPKTKKSLVNYVFGTRYTPEEKVERFIGKRTNIVKIESEWPPSVGKYLAKLAIENPISAKLGEAWYRQNLSRRETSSNELSKNPWENRVWWKKERKQIALLQCFAASQQRLVWCGAADIVVLSGTNILVFLSICQFIWAEYLRSIDESVKTVPENVEPSIQTMAIMSASEYWFRKVKAEPKGGDDRHSFLGVVGEFFRNELRSDSKMSYPGANGFALSSSELRKAELIDQFLDDCVSFGALEKFRHKSKTKSRGQSTKWYLSPILTPFFQIPTPRTKEPFYASVADVAKWIDDANIFGYSANLATKRSNASDKKLTSQLDLDLEKDG